ncbi:serine/threonine-protein kinase [Myceligenerans salitolerans]|uniref:Serine/threonine-protein kinase PknG n=1 Tax=Myceligenerans salitolerans TaxID=1230528 RepID=A0ABS3I475_9MICO|nr:serine/threonine-protein kinase [Myceligenerans salitolerans]MBO0607804.1 protein kinase [Myceligenerans salitolerans]
MGGGAVSPTPGPADRAAPMPPRIPPRAATAGVPGGTAATSSSRLSMTALGSAIATVSRDAQLHSTSSHWLREKRLGAGLTIVPTPEVQDPIASVMEHPELAEEKRYCSACGEPVGRARDGLPGRTKGFCAACGIPFDFAPSLSPGELVGGQYEVVGCIAHGGLGWIYLARDRNVANRWVVLKGLLNADSTEAYDVAVGEREFLAEVEHPSIVEIYNFARHAGAGYTVMEYVGGRSLKELREERRTPFPPDHAIAYLLEIMPAFTYLHDRGLLYCDFKPDNVVVQGDTVKLIDLGGVRRMSDTTTLIYGTRGFQAAEVARSGPSVASDIYTIGRTLATLVLDFTGSTSVHEHTLPSVEETPLFARHDSLHRWLVKACHPSRDDRFLTVEEARVQLLGVLREVVALERTGSGGATTSAASALFGVPPADGSGGPLRWDELPPLAPDPTDPMSSWVAGVNLTDPAARMDQLALAPRRTVEVLLAEARAALETGDVPRVRDTVGQILSLDPWEWRAAWMEGLAGLAEGDAAGAAAAFNAVYGQVPGELAPKLALACACEQSGELGVAHEMYAVCARTDANYTGAAAFGLARVRLARDDLDGALDALDFVVPTRGSYGDARLARARLLIGSGRGLPSLAQAAEVIDDAPVPARMRTQVVVEALQRALDHVLRHGPAPGIRVAGAVADEPDLRDALEAGLRRLAQFTESRRARVTLVDRANSVRRWTLR